MVNPRYIAGNAEEEEEEGEARDIAWNAEEEEEKEEEKGEGL